MVAGFIGIFGNVAAKEWATKSGLLLFLIALVWWVLAGVTFLHAMRYGTLTVLNTLAGLVGAVATVFVGLLYYRESVTSAQAAGLVFSLVGMALLLWPSR